MPRFFFHVCLLLVAGLANHSLCRAELRVARIFSDNAVLQQGKPIPVWGMADAGEDVCVKFREQEKTVQAGTNGRWQIDLQPMKSQSSGASLVVESADQKKEFRDVVVGEVWYASGQSNMQMKLESCVRKLPQLKQVTQTAELPNVRTFRIDEPDSAIPASDLNKPAAWQVDSAKTRNQNSAVAWFFAKQLHEQTNVPIGVIEGSWGGKPIEGFIPKAQFLQHQALRPILQLAEQDQLDALAKLEGGVIIRNTAGRPGRIFNARVSPIAPYAIQGFLWYQGESNAGRSEDPRNYRFKMHALVNGWRNAWGQPELPFYFVQLPAFDDSATGWVRLREEQRLSCDIKHSGMAVTIDLRDNDIHPANKFDVADRLARWAFQKHYGIDVPCSGPLFRSAEVKDGEMRVTFDHSSGGLMAASKTGIEPAVPTANAALNHFELADSDGQWYSANATIEKATVVVRSPLVPEPVAVRYACEGNPENANLYNSAGLPASPFCSDLRLLPWQQQPLEKTADKN